MIDSINFEGQDFMLDLADLEPGFAAHLMDCGMPGEHSETVAAIRSCYEIKGHAGNCRDYLAGCGCWDHDELQDHDENLNRLVWLAGCDLAENGEIFFCTYA